MRRRVDHRGDRSDLDDPPGIHDGHPIAGFGDHAHVVRDQHDRGAVLLAEPAQQRNDLRLDRHVECRRRLVGDDQARLAGERQRDHDALAHAAGELVRILIEALLGRRDAGLLQQPDRALASLGGADRQVRLDRLDQLLADRVQRIERRQRILEDRADVTTAHLAHLLVRQVVDPAPVESDFAAGDPAGRVEQADDGGAGERLACAGLADDAQNLAGRDLERDIVQRHERAEPGRKLDPQVADLEQRRGHAITRAGRQHSDRKTSRLDHASAAHLSASAGSTRRAASLRRD